MASVGRWSAAAVLAVGLGSGLASGAAAEAPPTTAVGTISGVVVPDECTIEVAVEIGSSPPSSTLPGTCATSAASGIVSRQGVQSETADPLPATGRSAPAVPVTAAIVLALGVALRSVARRRPAS